MAHHTLKSGYSSLVDRLNRYPQGAPPSQLLYRILALLFSQKEAELVAQLPIKQVMITQQMKSKLSGKIGSNDKYLTSKRQSFSKTLISKV